MNDYRNARKIEPCTWDDTYWQDCDQDSSNCPCCDECCPDEDFCRRPFPTPRPRPCCETPCPHEDFCHRPTPRPRPTPCCEPPCSHEDFCHCPTPRPCPRPRPLPCCEDTCSCDSFCHRPAPCPRPRPSCNSTCCCQEENLYVPCRPTSCMSNTCCPCKKESENLYISPDRVACGCGGSLSSELCNLIGKKVMIYLEHKRGPVCILGVDEKCVKALVIKSGKIIYINIDSIVSFKEIC